MTTQLNDNVSSYLKRPLREWDAVWKALLAVEAEYMAQRAKREGK